MVQAEKRRVLCRGNRTEVSVFLNDGKPLVEKRLLDFANVSTERTALYYEALLQKAADGPGVVPIIDQRLSHLTQIHELGEVPEEVESFLRSYVDGHSLRELAAPDLKEHLNKDRCLAWIARVAHTLHRIHTLPSMNGQPLRLVHRDVTWDNILIHRSELESSTPGDGAFLNDFGLAFVATWGELPLEETLQGAHRFLSPELKAGQQPTGASDVYQLGLTLCHLLATLEALPYDSLFSEGFSNPASESALALLRAYSAEACLEQDPRNRPTAQELGLLLSR